MSIKRTRRQWRKNRPKLSSGDVGCSGTVVKWFGEKGYGFIQPDNLAAQIIFYFSDIPRHREKCAGIDCQVYFSVVRNKNGRLKAVVL